MSAELAAFLREKGFDGWESAGSRGTLVIGEDNAVKFLNESGAEETFTDGGATVVISSSSSLLKDSFEAVLLVVRVAEELAAGAISERAAFGAKLKSIDAHFALRSFVVGYSFSSLDNYLVSVLEGTFEKNASFQVQLNQTPFLKRWFKIAKRIKEASNASSSSSSSSSSAEVVGETKEKKEVSEIERIVGHLQKIPDLDHVDPAFGVCTRFPPEPSGYLHVGHVKAALLNAHYAERYNGKLLIRFDDTNPSKEKEEYVESILADLKLLGINTSTVSYTSDHFDTIFEYAEKILREGKAYIDMTPTEELRRMRMEGIESTFRVQSIERNLELFDEMKRGTEIGQQCLMRAKIDMQAKNKVLRDPGLFRCVIGTPHLRTGDKYKAYPLYDFACPIVDSIEGVTHAFRSSEYHDRNVLYYWILDALNLRRVWIEDFSRLNFSYTLLSKRKLQWFVDNKVVEGWNSPAFPTFQGILRRGLEIPVLKTFIMAQGASKALTLMDINKLWALNRKFIDPIVPRFTAISKNSVSLFLSNLSSDPFSRVLPRHKKNDQLGSKDVFFSSHLIIEPADAKTFEQDEEITLMDWGNCFVRKIVKDDAGNVVSVEAELHLEGDPKKTSKKITWLSASDQHRPSLVSAVVSDFAFVINKKSLEPEDNWQSFISDPLVTTYEVIADSNLRSLKKGDKFQFERRGYFIVDKVGDESTPISLVSIPEGRQKGMASV